MDENLQLLAPNLDLVQRFTFQQDNDLKHMSKSVTVWLQENKITVQPWSSMSPNLNPIENLWKELKVWINCQSPKNLQELEHEPFEEWKKITEKTCSNLIKKL